MKNLLKNLILIVLIIAVAAGIGFLLFNASRSVNHNKNAKNPILTLEVEGYGEIQIELEPDYAPNTVATIVKLAQNGYYDGKVFYGTDTRAVTAGMVLKTEENTDEETGETTSTTTSQEDVLRVSDLDKNVTQYDEEKGTGDETKDYEVSIPGEFVANGFNDNTLRFEKGTVGLYRQNYDIENLSQESYNSGNSLFFITTDEDSSLNGEYAAFGKVVKGMDLVEKMLQLPVEQNQDSETGESTDVTAGNLEDTQEIKKFAVDTCPVISKATVETYGVDYGMPEYSKAFDYNQYMSDLIMQYYNSQQ